MNDRFHIVGDPQRSLIRIVMRGHWDVQTVRSYKEAIVAAVGRMRSQGCKPEGIVALVDLREGGAQSQEVITAYKGDLDDANLVPRRLATLVSSALFKRQVERIAIPNQRFFIDESEALDWLLSADPAG